MVACIISVRTRDECHLPTARRLFAVARTPAAVARLSVDKIDELIRASTFHEIKARNIRAIARRVDREFGGVLPADEAVLLSMPGVGPKCANLVLGIAVRRKASRASTFTSTASPIAGVTSAPARRNRRWRSWK